MGPRPSRPGVAICGLAALAGGVLACRTPRPCPAVPTTATAPAPRRDHCLAPPWVPDPARPQSAVAGWSAAWCTDGFYRYDDPADRTRRNAYFIHDGKRKISESEMKNVQRVLMTAGISSGLGGCCSARVSKETGVSCVKVWSDVCRLPMSQIVKEVDEALRDHGLTDVRVGVDVKIDGVVGPRCEATDPVCGPVSSREWDRPDAPPPEQKGCVAGRVRVAEPDQAEPGLACTQDGDCTVGECGSACLRWDLLPGQMWCEDVGRLEEPPLMYCGCVAGRCDWFRPVAP